MTDRTTTDPHRDTRSRWGRSPRLGGGTARLLLVSLAAGVVIALLIGMAAHALAAGQEHADPRFPLVMGALMAAVSLPVGSVLAWLLLVDRATVRGAVRDTEETIEGRWYEKATSGAFHDLLILVGLGTAAVSLARWDLDASTAGVVLLLAMAASAAIRYLVQKHRG